MHPRNKSCCCYYLLRHRLPHFPRPLWLRPLLSSCCCCAAVLVVRMAMILLRPRLPLQVSAQCLEADWLLWGRLSFAFPSCKLDFSLFLCLATTKKKEGLLLCMLLVVSFAPASATRIFTGSLSRAAAIHEERGHPAISVEAKSVGAIQFLFELRNKLKIIARNQRSCVIKCPGYGCTS